MASPADNCITLSWTPELAAYKPEQAQKAWSVATLKAPFYEPTSRAPIDVCAVIDKSGSMAGEKLRLVKETLEFVIDQLKECDRLSVVTYDSNVYMDFPLTKMTVDNKEKTTMLVKKIRDGSSTNLSGGLIRGMQEIASRGGEKAKVSSVLLLTDGLANVGSTSKEAILEEMRKIRNFDGTVYTFGFGSDHDAKMLEALSTQGGGVYYYIDSAEKIPESFADCLGGLLSVTGQNISLKLEAQGQNSITEVHTGKVVTWKTKNKCCEIAMGDLQSEEQRDVLLEVQLPVLPAPTTDLVVTATLTYFNVITSSLDTVTAQLNLERTAADPGSSSLVLDKQRNRILATAALAAARKLADEGKLDDSRAVLQRAIDTITASVSCKEEFSQGLLGDLRRSLEGMRSYQEYKSHGAHYLSNKMQSHAVQRSNFVSEASSYHSSAKAFFVSKSKAKKS